MLLHVPYLSDSSSEYFNSPYSPTSFLCANSSKQCAQDMALSYSAEFSQVFPPPVNWSGSVNWHCQTPGPADSMCGTKFSQPVPAGKRWRSFMAHVVSLGALPANEAEAQHCPRASSLQQDQMFPAPIKTSSKRNWFIPIHLLAVLSAQDQQCDTAMRQTGNMRQQRTQHPWLHAQPCQSR